MGKSFEYVDIDIECKNSLISADIRGDGGCVCVCVCVILSAKQSESGIPKTFWYTCICFPNS